jgi:hypothetical protein
MGNESVVRIHGIHPAAQPTLAADDLQVLEEAGFQVRLRETSQMVQERFRIDDGVIASQAALNLFRRESTEAGGSS